MQRRYESRGSYRSPKGNWNKKEMKNLFFLFLLLLLFFVSCCCCCWL
jgi:hypothetical protein